MKVRFQLYWLLVVLTQLTSWGRWHESQLGLGSGKSFHKLWSHYNSHSGGEGRRSSSSRFRDTHAKESKSYTLHCIKPCSLPTLNQIQPPECTRMDKRSILSNDVFRSFWWLTPWPGTKSLIWWVAATGWHFESLLFYFPLLFLEMLTLLSRHNLSSQQRFTKISQCTKTIW